MAVTLPLHYRHITVTLLLQARTAASLRVLTVPLPFHYRSFTVTLPLQARTAASLRVLTAILEEVPDDEDEKLRSRQARDGNVTAM